MILVPAGTANYLQGNSSRAAICIAWEVMAEHLQYCARRKASLARTADLRPGPQEGRRLLMRVAHTERVPPHATPDMCTRGGPRDPRRAERLHSRRCRREGAHSWFASPVPTPNPAWALRHKEVLRCQEPGGGERSAARTREGGVHRSQDPARWSVPLPGPCAGRPAIPVAILVLCPCSAFPSARSHPRLSAVSPASPARPATRAPLVRALLEGPAAAAALALPGGPAEAACALCQRAPREPVRADCGHRFCRACVVRFWAEEDGPFPCPECADDCWQRAVEPGRPPLSRRLLALEEAAAAPARDGPASEAALQLLCRADGGPLCAACRMAAGPEPPEWEPRWRKALRGKENKGSVEIMRKDLNDARDLHGQAESAAAVWKGHVMDRRKKALTDYKKLRAFFAEEEGRFLQEAEKEEGSPEDEDEDPAERFRSLLQAVSELERRHRNLGLSMLLQ
ncbi:E3 ubiquitin-protein ligase RNF187 [Camelus ferus]|uniref:E3 ubiquitin-protein ligase RNF187 n=1 Tax=Camelus ferus TaxID=419612 RepID=A0A8B8S3P3_CAMFR|nr:E3 ubiquitin-protein ligase RNF187 [Camelus ferus]